MDVVWTFFTPFLLSSRFKRQLSLNRSQNTSVFSWYRRYQLVHLLAWLTLCYIPKADELVDYFGHFKILNRSHRHLEGTCHIFCPSTSLSLGGGGIKSHVFGLSIVGGIDGSNPIWVPIGTPWSSKYSEKVSNCAHFNRLKS